MAWLSLAVLTVIIIISCFSKINPGLLALGSSWLLGYYGAHMRIDQVIAGFPSQIFIVLVGVTYLFGIAKHNGTLERLTFIGLRLIKGKSNLTPLLFFLLAALLSTLGAGNIGAVALLAPVAMVVAKDTGIGGFLMTIALICGANAGAFSPFSLTGIIANGLINNLGLPLSPWKHVYLPSFVAQTFLLLCFYALFAWRIQSGKLHIRDVHAQIATNPEPWNFTQKCTLFAILCFILSTVFLKTDIGFLSLCLGCALTFIGTQDAKESIKHIPWDIILMVCGINMLIGVMQTSGGISLFVDLLAKISTPLTVNAMMAMITGFISAFSSSSGVVMPTFIPLVPDLLEKIGGGNATAIITSINVGAHVVDVSPLSTLGAICVASAVGEDKEKLFRWLLVLSLCMTLVGAIICSILGIWIQTSL